MLKFAVMCCPSKRVVRPYVQPFPSSAIGCKFWQVQIGRRAEICDVSGQNVGEQTGNGFCKTGCTRLPVAVVDAVAVAKSFSLRPGKLVEASQ